MKVSCPSCNTSLNIDDKKIPAGGARIKCPSCQNVFPVKPPAPASAATAAVPLPGISAPKAQPQSWEDEPTRAVPLPGGNIPGATMGVAPPSNIRPGITSSPSSAGIPLPGISAPKPQPQQWEEEATRVANVPLPGAAQGIDMDMGATATVPLPGLGGQRPSPADDLEADFSAAPTGAIPLPGGAPTAAMPAYVPPAPPPLPPRSSPSASIPLPGSSRPSAVTSAPAASIPLPGGASRPSSPGGTIPLPGASSPSSATVVGSIPLPGASSPSSATVVGSIPLPGGAGASGGIPLPGASGGDDMEFDISGPSTATHAAHVPGGFDFGEPATAAESVPESFDFSEAPPEQAAAPGAFDFGAAPPAAAPVSGGFDFGEPAPAAAPVSGGFDFDAAPPPAAAAPGAFDFAAAPPPASAPGAFDFGAPPPAAPAVSGSGAFDFGAPPPPATSSPSKAPMGFDFGAAPPPPAPAAPSMGFGEVDFGAGASAGGDLEFDPTAARPKDDDLEADLSAPIPAAPAAPAGPADGLEMLSFIDDTAKDAGAKPEDAVAVRRFHIKRRSGKVFGPFEEAVISKMLEDGQLLGNEEVSLDTESWQPIGSEPAFQATIARLMESPARTQTQQGLPQVDDKPKGPSMDRLKQLYEGRMAAVAVVQGKEPVPFKKRVPYIVAGVLVASVVIGGVFLGLATPYGFFALKLLFPAKVKPDTREFGYLQAARKGFLTDNWKGYKSSKESATQALAIKEFPEARAIWCQSVFYLQRKYQKADPNELAQAKAELVNVKLLGEKHPEVLKTLASDALTDKQPDAAMGFIADAVARDANDLEAMFLRAEAYQQKKQPAQAKAEYEAILKKDAKSARALHALGLLHRAGNEFNEAAGKFSEALEADPQHLSSAVELAEVVILKRRETTRGEEVLAKVLTDEAKPLLSTNEQGKALALKAEIIVVGGKLKDAVPLFEEALKADPNNAFTQGRLAHAYLELHQPEAALPLFQKAAGSAPENLELTEGYLSALIALGKMDEATRLVASANTRFPGNATLSYLGGRVSDALDNPKDAEEAYKRAIASDPNLADAYLYLSRLYIRFRRFQEARPQLEAGLEKAPDNAALRVGMGELAFHERDLDRAEKEFKRAAELDAQVADAHLGLSRVSLERGKYDLAAAQVEKALELNPRIAGGRLQRGTALWKLNRLDEAIKELEQARAEDPRNTQLTVTLGAVEFEKGDFPNAIAHLNSALVAEPGHADGNFYMARVKNAKSEHTQAIEYMRRALDMNGKNPLYRYWMGRCFNDARKTDDAIAEWKLALEIDPKYADALEAMGKVYFERNDFKKAVKQFQAALEADPARNGVRASIGDAQGKMEDWDGAIKSYLQALDADPDLKFVYFKLGQAYEEKKAAKSAIEWYLKATQAEPNNAETWVNLGWLYKDQKKPKEAVVAFQKYLEMSPEADIKRKKEIEDEIDFLRERLK